MACGLHAYGFLSNAAGFDSPHLHQIAMKYIMKKNWEFAIFPDSMEHNQTARLLEWKKEDIQGAGFVRFGCGDHQEGEAMVQCYGESISLGIKSAGEADAAVIRRSHATY